MSHLYRTRMCLGTVATLTIAVFCAAFFGDVLVSVSAAAEKAAPKGNHWSFQPITRPNPPTVKDSVWSRNPIDRFILARLEAKGLKPSPEASRRALVRRLSLDLIGLPPTPQQADAFVGDKLPGAYEKLVDRLLASPRYGEHWARMWLGAGSFFRIVPDRPADPVGGRGANKKAPTVSGRGLG